MTALQMEETLEAFRLFDPSNSGEIDLRCIDLPVSYQKNISRTMLCHEKILTQDGAYLGNSELKIALRSLGFDVRKAEVR